MRQNRLFILVVVAAAMILAVCGTSDSTASAATTEAETTTETIAATETSLATVPETTTDSVDVAEAAEAPEPDNSEPSCDWDSERMSSNGTGNVPASEGDDVTQAVLGSWQHTHIDTGGGFEPLSPTTDIRYVLTSDRFLYCQDVEGATDQSENSAPLKVEGIEIILPSPATGYAVATWDDNTMVWLNHRDDSLYLLQRR